MSTANQVGRYKGVDFRWQRLCDVSALPSRQRYYFTYIGDTLTGDHFSTLRCLYAYIDGGMYRDQVNAS